MKRLLAILLALLLPLQLSWAAVGEYCQHESSPKAAQHFGHHSHVHKSDGKHDAGKKLVDSDCSFCHAGTPATMTAVAPRVPTAPAQTTAVPSPQAPLTSALAREPDRPQWLRLV